MWLSEIFVVILRAQSGAALQAVAGLCWVGHSRAIREWLSPQCKELFKDRSAEPGQHPCIRYGNVREVVGCTRRYVDCFPCVGGDLFAAEGELDLALKDVEHLLEVVAVLLPYL